MLFSSCFNFQEIISMEGCISGLNSKSHSNERTLRRIFLGESFESNFTGMGDFKRG